MKHSLYLALATSLLFLQGCEYFKTPKLYIYSSPSNDLSVILEEQDAFNCIRLDDLDNIKNIPDNASVIILSDHYPLEKVILDSSIYDLIREKNIRAYIEYPSFIPGIDFSEPEIIDKQRVVVSSTFFNELDSLTILQINGLSYIGVENDLSNVHLTAARVAGFDSAIFGLPEKSSPLLFETLDYPMLFSLTCLSNFVSGRYSPNKEWAALWKDILQYVLPGVNVSSLEFQPVVQPTYSKNEPLRANAQKESIQRGIEWFEKSKMLIHPSFMDSLKEFREAGIQEVHWDPGRPSGDGTFGVFECMFSKIDKNGRQPVGLLERGDCNSETAMAFALAGKYLNNKKYSNIAENLIDYYLYNTNALEGKYSDPNSAGYGLIPWGITNEYWRSVNYGDDNARFLIATIITASILETDKWDDIITTSLIGLLRTTGINGFRGNTLVTKFFDEQDDWKYYFNRDLINLRPHFEAYLWACYLWAYDKTGYDLFLDRARKGIDIMMDNYPDGLTWTNGLAQEKARMLLPLAWLLKVDNTFQNKAYLYQVVEDIIELQDEETGAIREELGDLKKGRYPPPQSNEAYGTNEASLIAQNGDPVADLIYTVNFALLGLHEAAYATRDESIKEVEDKLTEFLIRIQVDSKSPQFDGGWMRAFDFERFEHWGSNADSGWGAWCIETGWTQSWIVSILTLREMGTSIWDISKNMTIDETFKNSSHLLIE